MFNPRGWRSWAGKEDRRIAAGSMTNAISRQIPLKSIGEVSELFEETINRVRQGPLCLLRVMVPDFVGFCRGGSRT